MAGTGLQPPRASFRRRLERSKYLYLLFAAPFLFYVLFEYAPMYGVLIAFKEIKVFRGLGAILTAPSVGFKYFEQYLADPYFWQLVRNTVLIRVLGLAVGFPAPIVLALMLNEVRGPMFKRTIQSIMKLTLAEDDRAALGVQRLYAAAWAAQQGVVLGTSAGDGSWRQTMVAVPGGSGPCAMTATADGVLVACPSTAPPFTACACPWMPSSARTRTPRPRTPTGTTTVPT